MFAANIDIYKNHMFCKILMSTKGEYNNSVILTNEKYSLYVQFEGQPFVKKKVVENEIQ